MYWAFFSNTDFKVNSVLSGETVESFKIPEGHALVEINLETFNLFLAMIPTTHFMEYNGSIFITKSIPDNPAVIDKTDITANKIDMATISGIINPSLITIEEPNENYTVTDGEFTVAVDTPGYYVINVITIGYLNREFIINAS